MALTLRLRRFATSFQLGKTNRFWAIWRGLTYGKAVLYCAFRALLDVKVSCVAIGRRRRTQKKGPAPRLTRNGAFDVLAPAAGLEPATGWLTATYSTTELCRNTSSDDWEREWLRQLGSNQRLGG